MSHSNKVSTSEAVYGGTLNVSLRA